MIIEPIRDKKTGNVLTNVQIIKMSYEKLKELRDGVGCKTKKEREANEDKFYKICGGSTNAKNIMEYMEQIVSEPDEDKAQKLFERTLIPVLTK